MLAVSATLVLFDMTDHALVCVELPHGHILHRARLACDEQPLALLIDGCRIYLFANSRTHGTLYTLSDDCDRLVRASGILPSAEQVCLSPDGTSLYLSSHSHRIYRFLLSEGKLTSLISSDTACLALACQDDCLYTVRESPFGSIFACYDQSGTPLYEHLLSGVVTTLCLKDDICYLPFVKSRLHGEGLYLFDLANTTEITTISLGTRASPTMSVYPYSVLTSPDVIYLVCENGAAVTCIDAHTHRIEGSIFLGRSITRLYALPDSRFALATSNMFADLLLVDLVNRRLLTLSLCSHELFHQLIVLPQ